MVTQRAAEIRDQMWKRGESLFKEHRQKRVNKSGNFSASLAYDNNNKNMNFLPLTAVFR